MSGISPNRSRSPPPPPPPPPLRNGATSPTRISLQPISTAGLPNKTRQPPGVPGTPPPVPGSGPLLRSGSVTNKPDARPMSPVSTGPKLEPSATEGRWTFRSAVDFPIPPQPISNPGKVYPSGNSSGTSIPLDLSSLVGVSAGRMPPPPPIGGGGRYR